MRLIEAAESEIAEHGLQGLKARNVTTKAGCALGGLYNVVTDLDGLIILVNSKTLARLGDTLKEVVPHDAAADQAIQSLAQAYVAFAMAETNLWHAVFNHRLPENQELPQWHQKEYMVLIENIVKPLHEMFPDLVGDALALRAQTLFAAVHGVVQMSLNGQFAGSPREYLSQEVKALVGALVRGIEKGRGAL
ncbi:TetR-like C-terminal domain-containing protein [uncultured Sulfitobacter sp.]|uniref:TetR/AcrR family transcriptional regulator n=1 Tax=uncultured Sulfitobacter sp. TaxID=191468 RepID=UPI0026021CEB|nr:TetR-like C-terminal domain-containing protein [uncultured Sulfitobacter sp.]